MTLTPEELQIVIEKKIDKIILFSQKKPILSVDIEELIRKRIESDPNLKKHLVTLVLQSEE
jgi:hypothetical protein